MIRATLLLGLWSGATLAAPQFPLLLQPYPARPTWQVSGVDIQAGLPTGTKLQDPATLNLPGVSVDVGQHRVTITGPSVILAGWDFGLEGGWNVTVEGANDTITMSNWRVGANNLVPVQCAASASGTAITRSSIDGGGLGVAGNPGAIWSLISCLGTGLVVRHNWLHDAPQHVVEFRSGTLIESHNLIDRLGFSPGAHPNASQFAGGIAVNSRINYNTIYNPQPVNGYPHMNNESVQIEAQLGATITNTEAIGNIVICQGPGAGTTGSYAVAVRQDAGNVINGVKVSQNWIDPSGCYGSFYPPSGSNVVYAGNMNLATGAPIPAPQPQ